MSRPADLSVPDFSVMDIQAQIQACANSMIIKKEVRPDAAGERTALLFTGVNQHQVPHDLLFSQALTPNEKTTWQVMRALTSMNPTGSDAPRREDIALAVGCTETTVTKARQLLRLNRWLTFCQRVRDDQGRIIGDIYLMHEEPWPLWETLLIDTEYALFVQEIAASTTTRYPKAARALAKSIAAEIEAIENPAATSFFGHALTRTKARISESDVGDITQIATDEHKVKNFNQVNDHKVKNFNQVPEKNFYPRSSSSNVNDNAHARALTPPEHQDVNFQFESESLNFDDHPALFARYFPQFANSKILHPAAWALWEQRAYYPIIQAKLKNLGHPEYGRVLLCQPVGRQLASKVRVSESCNLADYIRNFPAFLDALTKRVKQQEFTLDEHGQQVRRALEDNDPSQLIGLYEHWREL